MEILVEFLAKGFMTMLSISMPCVLVAASVGLVVGILQAVTQVQEQTIAAAPKICLVFLSIVVLGGYFFKIITNYIYEGVHIAFYIVPRQDSYVLPADYYRYTRPFSAEMRDRINDDASLNKALVNQGDIPWDKKVTKHQYNIKAKQTPVQEPNFIEKIKINSNRR